MKKLLLFFLVTTSFFYGAIADETQDSNKQDLSTDKSIKADSNTDSNTDSSTGTSTYKLDAVTATSAKTQREIFYENDNIASVSGEALTKLNIQNSKDLSQVFSGLYITNSGGSAYPSISLRGMHTDYYYAPSMRIYVDGVPQDIFFLNQELLDVESVELFKGYGGTLFGENAQAGILSIHSNIISNKTKVTASTSFGELERNVIGSASGALIKNKLYAKVSFKHADFLGQVTNTQTNKLADTSTNNLARISLLYNDEAWFAGLDYYYDKSVNHDIFYLTDSQLSDISNLRYDFSANGVPNIERTVQTYAFKFGYNGDNIAVNNVFSVQDRTMPITSFGSTWEENNTQYTNELKVTQTYSNDSTSLYGLYLAYTDFNHKFLIDTARAGDTNHLQTIAFALFTDHKIILPANFDLSLGLRYSYYKNYINYTQGLGTVSPSFSDQLDQNLFAARIALSYTLFNNHKFYTSFSRGFRAGGFPNAIFGSAYQVSYKPETNYTAEIGYKGFFLDDKIYINMDYFFIYTQDRQENALLYTTTPPTAIMGTVGDSISQGFEFEGKYNFLENSFFMLNLAYIDSRYNKAHHIQTGADISGRQVFFVPAFSLNASIDSLLWKNSFIGLYANIGFSYNTRIHFTETYSQKPYYLLNIGFRAEFKNLILALNMQNITNQLYDTYGYSISGVGYHQIGRLRNISFNLTARF